MKLYGYIKLSEKTKDGFVMPIFKNNENTLFFQRIEMDNKISLVKLDLEKDICDPIIKYERIINIDLDEEVLAYLDDGIIYLGNKDYIYNMAKTFKSYEKYKKYFIKLKNEIDKENKKAFEDFEKAINQLIKYSIPKRQIVSSVRVNTVNKSGVTISIPKTTNSRRNVKGYRIPTTELQTRCSLVKALNDNDLVENRTFKVTKGINKKTIHHINLTLDMLKDIEEQKNININNVNRRLYRASLRPKNNKVKKALKKY